MQKIQNNEPKIKSDFLKESQNIRLEEKINSDGFKIKTKSPKVENQNKPYNVDSILNKSVNDF